MLDEWLVVGMTPAVRRRARIRGHIALDRRGGHHDRARSFEDALNPRTP